MQGRDMVAGVDGITYYCPLCERAFPDLLTSEPDSLTVARRERDEHMKTCRGPEEPIRPRR